MIAEREWTEDEIRAKVAEIAAASERRKAELAEVDYRRTVSLRRDYDEVIITVEVDPEVGLSYRVQGVGITRGHGGHDWAGGDAARYFQDLDEARGYANGWVGHLLGKGYIWVR